MAPKRHSIRKPMTLPPAAQPKIGRDRPSVLEMSVPSPTTDQTGRAGRGHPTADFRPAGALGRSVRVKPPRSGAKAGRPGIGTEEPKPPMIEFGGSCHLAAIGVQIAKSHSRTCAPGGRGACRSSELLHHVIAREAGRLAVDRRRDTVALFLVEAWRLNTERRQRDPGAAATSALLFCRRQYAAADPCALQILGQKEPGDIDEPEFGPSV